jgi:hypothetical protein
MFKPNSNPYSNSKPNYNYNPDQVRGSNESRPRLLVGDVVRLRPLLADLDMLSNSYPFFFQKFELIGNVLLLGLEFELELELELGLDLGLDLVLDL